MEPIGSSETSASNTQTPGNYPKESRLLVQHGENQNLRMTVQLFVIVPMNNSWTCSGGGVQMHVLRVHDVPKCHQVMVHTGKPEMTVKESLELPPARGLLRWAVTVGMLWAPTSLPWSVTDHGRLERPQFKPYCRLGWATIRLTGKECKEETGRPSLQWLARVYPSYKLTCNTAKMPQQYYPGTWLMHTGIATIQEPWRV